MLHEAFDLCVIGAGMFGSASARHASVNPSLKVCLIGPSEPTEDERPNREIFGSHYDEGRITRVLDEQAACHVLSKHAIRRYGELEKLSEIKFHTPAGCLFIAERPKDFIQNIIQSAHTHKASFVELSDKDVLKRRYPYLKLKDQECAILDDTGAGHISPRRLVQAQKRVAQMQGCIIIDDVACKVETLDNGMHRVHGEKGQIVLAKRLLISTGVFVNMKKFEPLKKLAIKRYKVTAVLLRIPENEVNRLSSLPDIIVRRNSGTSCKGIGSYVLPPIKYPDGNYYLKFGDSFESNQICETLDEMRDWFLSNGDGNLIMTHLPLVTELLPGLQYTNVSKMTCISCYTATGLPYVDRVSPTVTVAVGGNGKGAKFSDEIGRIAAKLCVTGEWDSELNQNQFRAVFDI